MKKVAIYARVSIDWNQAVENQLRELQEVAQRVAQRQGWLMVAVHAGEGISGAKGRDKRPAFDALLKSIAPARSRPRGGVVRR